MEAIKFEKKDVEDGLLYFMEEYAEDMGTTVPEMLKRIFIRRVAKDGAFKIVTGETSPDFLEDKVVVEHMLEKYDINQLYGAMVVYYDKKFSKMMAEGIELGDVIH